MTTPNTPDPTRDAIMRMFADLHRGTARLIGMAPEADYDWRPAEGMFTLGELVAHVAQIPRMGVRGLLQNDWQQPSVPEGFDASLATRLHDECVQQVLDDMAQVSDQAFAKRLIRVPWGPEMTLARGMLILIEHDVHHRTQLFLYLKLRGQSLNSLALFG